MRSHALPNITWLALIGAIVLMGTPARGQTETSPEPTEYPEDGAPLPRADMPEGGVDEGLPRADMPQAAAPDGPGKRADMPEGGVKPGGLPRAGMPEGGVEGPHGAYGVPGEAADGEAPDDVPSRRDLLDCLVDDICIRWDGYLRVEAEAIQNDALPFVGRNDGFRIGNARLGLEARYGKDLSAYVSIDGAVAEAESPNDPNAQLLVGLKDAYLEYDISSKAAIRVGSFKVPYDLGELEATGERTFINRPLESAGVRRTRGREVDGLRQGRQIGLMIHRDRLGLTEESFDLGFAIALTNGRTEGLALNDNDHLAAFARLGFHFGPWVSVFAAGFLDSRTTGDLPNLFEDNVKGAEGSLVVHLGDLSIEGQFLYQHIEHVTSGIDSIDALGFHAQWSYRIWDLEIAYRYGWFDPAEDRSDVDLVSEHTVALSYLPSSYPLRFTVSGTLADEDVEIDNNRINLLGQISW